MNYYNGYGEADIVDEILEAIETEYGRKIERVVKLDDIEEGFKITIIFSDYRLLEAKVKVKTIYTAPSVVIQGTYY